MNQVIPILQSHRSIRKFTDQTIDDEMLHQIIRCGQAAATSSNLQATTVINVKQTETRKEISRLAGNQDYVVSAGAKKSCWTLEMKELVGKESRPHMKGFLKSRGFSMK